MFAIALFSLQYFLKLIFLLFFKSGFTETAGQTQDFTKAYGNVSQTAAKPSNSVVATSASDLASAGYGKAHAQVSDLAINLIAQV